jgi:hypothetical protein
MTPQKNVALEPDVSARVAAEAEEQGRTPDALTNEATKRFLALRRVQDLQKYGRERAAELGLAEDDVPRLIAESRAERQR